METLSLTDLIAQANQHLDDYGLYAQGWRATLDDAKKRGGVCNYTKRQIGLSRHIMATASYAEQKETILHEIAHALMPGHGHDAAWKARLIAMGGTGKRTHTMQTPTGRYAMTCSKHGVVGHRHQKQGTWKYATEANMYYTHKNCGGSLWLVDTKGAKADVVIATKPTVEETLTEAASLLGCKCGCGGATKGGNYLPGHDARHVSQVFARWIDNEFDADGAMVELPTPALQAKLAKRISAWAVKTYK